VLTTRERLTAPGVVIHLPRCCAPARYAGVRFECGYGPREACLERRPGLHFSRHQIPRIAIRTALTTHLSQKPSGAH
jgi:hypothetical protein